MMKCSNCEKENLYEKAVLVRHAYSKEQLANLCEDCIKGVLTMKIVLSRKNEGSEFTFEGYLPVSSVK